MAIVLALTAAACWGCSDFLAGMASRRLAVPWVLLLVEAGGLLVIGLVVLITRPAFFDDASDVLLAIAAGLSGVLALGCFYRALAIGTMSVVAPISATGVALPVVVGIATGNRLSAVAAAGMVLIVSGVALASREQHDDDAAAAAGRASIALALVAAVGFGGFFALSDAPADASVPWTLMLVRAAPIPLVALLASRARRPAVGSRFLLGVAGIGTIDLAATALIAVANTKGELSIVSVLGGMYPVATVLLAAGVLHERVRASQLAGIVLALVGVAAVAAG
jgi:drug/metabolite transporter (DMT)-like permease